MTTTSPWPLGQFESEWVGFPVGSREPLAARSLPRSGCSATTPNWPRCHRRHRPKGLRPSPPPTKGPPPLFPYFGRKARIANAYPAPEFDLIIEPFAGSMAWSLHHRPSLALGFEVDTRVVSLWERIMAATEPESPPILGSKTDDLLVKLCSYSEHSLTSGPMTVTSRMLRDWDSLWRRFLDQGVYAREHLQIVEGSYLDAPDVEATWFIDPPYQRANRRGYLHGASTINFAGLAEWCRSRRGQVIVCEQEGADWLPFEPLTAVSSHRGAISTEVVWLQGGR